MGEGGYGEISILGELLLRKGGGDRDGVAVPGRLVRRLFLRLLIAGGRTVETAALCEDVWNAPVAVETLRVQLSRLRRLVEPLGVRVTNTGRGWTMDTSQATLDAARFERHRGAALAATDAATVLHHADAALDLWRGRAYEDVDDEPWCRPEAERLTLQRSALAQCQAEALLWRGRTDDAIAALHRIVTAQPYDETAGIWLAASQFLAGRQPDALRSLALLRERLADDLGLDPSPPTQRIEHVLLTGGEGLTALLLPMAPIGPLPVARGWASHREEPRSTPPAALLGRTAEWRRLTGAAADAIAVIVGEEGIGKSTLADAATLARTGLAASTFMGYCTADSGVPFEPVAEIVQSLAAIGAVLPPSLLALLEGPDRAASGSSTVTSPEQLGLHLAIAVQQLRRERAVTLRVEDVHWASRSTLRCLRTFVDAVRNRAAVSETHMEPLQVLITHRPAVGEGADELKQLAVAAARWEASAMLELGGLADHEVGSLLERHGVDGLQPHLSEITALTSGNPLLVRELANELRTRRPVPGDARDPSAARGQRLTPAVLLDAVPAGIEALTAGRVARLSPDAQDLLRVVACQPARSTYPVLRRVLAPLPDDELFRALDECLLDGILVDNPSTDAVTFRHGYFQRVVYSGLGPARRQQLHARIGRALDALGEPVGEVAAQLHRAGAAATADERIASALGASESARQAGAFDDAARHAQHALDLCPPEHPRHRHVQLALALAMHQSGNPFEAKLHAATAATAAIAAGDVETAVAAIGTHASYGRGGGADDDSLRLIDLALASPALANDAAQAILRANRAEHRAMWLGTGAESAEEAGAAALVASASTDAHVTGIALYSASMALLSHRDVETRLAHATRLESNGRLHRRAIDEARAQRLYGMLALQRGDRRTIEQIVERAALAASEPGAWYLRNDAARWSGCLAIADGEWERAAQHISGASETSLGVAVYVEGAEAQRMLIRLERGTASADDPLFGAMADQPVAAASLMGARGLAAAMAGDLDTARSLLARMLGRMDGRCHHRNHLSELGLAAYLADVTNTTHPAEALLEWMEPYAGQMSMVGAGEYMLGAFDRFRGAMASLLGRHDEALQLQRAALAHETQQHWPVCRAHTLSALARAQQRAGAAAGDLEAARGEAVAEAHRFGLSALVRWDGRLADTQEPPIAAR